MPRILGPIVRLQVQRSPLKVGEKPHRRYDPAPILEVERLRLSPEGTIGLVDGQEFMDVHHRSHPQTRQNRPEKGLSLGFTGHYREMQRRYGSHMTVGCAGENVIVDLPRRISLDEVLMGLAILGPDRTERVRLGQLCVAHPCKPFSGFALGGKLVEPEVLKETLQFMDEGMRGFRCVPDVTAPVEIEVGDLVVVLK